MAIVHFRAIVLSDSHNLNNRPDATSLHVIYNFLPKQGNYRYSYKLKVYTDPNIYSYPFIVLNLMGSREIFRKHF